MKKIKSQVLCSVLAILFLFCGCSAKGISGDDWILMQHDTISELQTFSEEMDDVYTLYIIGSISSDDFLTELDVLQQEYQIMKAAYDQDKENNPILPEDCSYAAQKGMDALDSIWETLWDALNCAVQDDTLLSVEEISYSYMAYQQELYETTLDYLTSYLIISGQEEA